MGYAIKNLIFDLGGVILNIDPDRTYKAFAELGVRDFSSLYTLIDQNDLFVALEKGRISPGDFRKELNQFTGLNLSDSQIDTAWNSMLLDIPSPRIDLLLKLRKQYKLFLLSNTNEIHYKAYSGYIRETYGHPGLESFFGKCYFSCRMGLRKPEPLIFQQMLADSKLNPGECLFIDDALVHVRAATTLGIQAFHLQAGEDITTLFDPQSLDFIH